MKLNNLFTPRSLFAAVALAALTLVPGAPAATITKAATGTDLTDGASWGGTAPGSGDVATWLSTSLGAGLTLGSSASWGGIGVAGALSAISVTGAGPLTNGSDGINMSAATVNLTWGTPIELGASQTWTVNSGRTLTASGIISGTGLGLTKAGLGTLTLSGANTFDGTLTLSGGTLVADTLSTATILSSSSPLAFTSSGTFQLKGLSGQARSQILNGLSLTGGAATIDANNVAGGTSTTIDLRGTGGTLTITRSAGATADFKATTGTFGTTAIVNTAQANDATGILGAWATVNTGADWAINDGLGIVTNYTGYNTLSGNTLASAGTVNYRVATNPTTPTGNITLDTTGTIDINTLRISDTAARTIDVRNSTTQGILRFGAVGGLLTSGGSHVIGLSGTDTVGTITAGGSDNTAGELIINNATALTVNSLIANNGSGAVSLTKSGNGTLTITNKFNSFTGPTIVNAGTLTVLPTSGALGAGTPNVTVQSGATLNLSVNGLVMGSGGTLYLNGGTFRLAFNGTTPNWQGAVVLNANSIINTASSGNGGKITGNISGPGGFTKTGADKMWINGNANTYTGPTVVSANSGVLTFQYSLYGNNPSQWTPANITVGSGSTLALNVGGTSEFTPSQAGAFFSGLTTVTNNGLQAGSIMGFDISNAGAAVQTVSATLTDSTGPGGGAVGLNVLSTASGGTLELTGANTFSGPVTTDRNNTLKVASLNSVSSNPGLGTVHSASSSLGAPTTVANGTISLGNQSTYQGGTLLYTGTGETTDRVIKLGGANGTTYTLDQSGSGLLKFVGGMTHGDQRGPKTFQLRGSTAGTGEFAGAITNSTSGTFLVHLTKAGTGTWTLSGANLYGGLTTVSGGVLVLSNALAIPGGIGATGGTTNLTFNGGVIGLGANDFNRPLNTATTAGAATFTGHGGWAAYGADRIVNLGGASAPITWATANTGLNGKTLILGASNSTHTVDFQNPLDLGTAAARTVQVDNGAAAIDGNLSGILSGGVGGNLNKTGSGTLVLSGANSYTGTTTVSAGTLLVNGTNSGTGAFTVNSGATNGGTGTIAGDVTYSTGSSALFTNGATLNINGSLTVIGSVTVHLNLSSNLAVGTYILATNNPTGSSGSFLTLPVIDIGSVIPGGSAGISTTGSNVILTVYAPGACPAIGLLPSTLPNLPTNVFYSQTLTPAGGVAPYTNTVILGSLPPGLTLTEAGLLSGTPDTLGTYSFSVQAEDANGCKGTNAYSMQIMLPANFSWLNAAAGNWSDAANWTNEFNLVAAPDTLGQPNYILNFNQAGTYTAANDLTDGFLLNQLNFGAASGTLTLAGNGLAFTNNGATLPQINQNGAAAVSVSNNLALDANTTFGGTGNGQVTLASLVAGPGSLIKNGSGTLLLLSANNTYGGGTVINAGTITAGPNVGATTNGLGTGPVTLNNGATLQLQQVNTVTNDLTVNVNGGTIASVNGWGFTWGGNITLNGNATVNTVSGNAGNPNLSGGVSGAGGLIATGSKTCTLSGVNTYTGTTTISGGKLVVGGSGQLGSGNYAGSITNNATFTYNSSAAQTLAGAISGTGALNQSGPGTLTLAGTNTYTGATTITNGTLLVNNLSGSGTGTGTVNINSGGTLGGTGIIAGIVTNNAGGTLSPGTSPGTLTILSNLVLNADSTNTFEVDGSTPTNDVIVLGAGVTYGGMLNIVPTGTFTPGQTFTLFSGAGATNASSFASLAGDPGGGNSFSFTNGVLTVVGTGPSLPATLTNSVSGGVLSLSWPASQGWRLEYQTNALSVGLATNWMEAADSSVSSTNITIDSTQPTVFYRLIYP